jgi:V8-like Glu-specific endopeptidase
VAGAAPVTEDPAARAKGVISVAQQEVDNQAQYPWQSVVFIESTFLDGTVASGSGAMVGPNDVLTAAHVVYSLENGGAATEVTVTPAFDPDPHEEPFGTVDAYAWHYFPDFELGAGGLAIIPGDDGPSLGGTELDVALLDLDVPLGNETGWMGLDPTFQSGYVNVTGYPSYYGSNMMNDSGYVQDDAVDWFTDSSNLETYEGNSGGPLWYFGDDGLPYVVGVVSTGGAAHDIAAEYDMISGLINSNDDLIALAIA